MATAVVNAEYRVGRKVVKIWFFSKMCPNFEPRLRGVVYQLSWVTIHNIKPTHVDYYHVEGFKDCSMYSRKNLVLIIHTRDETPCSRYT